jgi:Mn2+/Fe2+ NRAMP family transporter
MALLLKAIAGFTELVLLAVTLFGQVLALGGVLLASIKVAVVVIFFAVLALILFFLLRDRFRNKRETTLRASCKTPLVE